MTNKIKIRACPLCENSTSTSLFRLSLQEIVSVNWSYQPEKFDGLEFKLAPTFDIVRCKNCDFVYSGQLPTNEFLSFVYDELINISAARRYSYEPKNMALRMRYLSTLLELLNGSSKVLDFGCGFGPTLSLLENIEGVETVGFETSSARAEELRSWHSNIVEDIYSLSACDPFDVIILDNVLEHVPEPIKTIEMLGSICAKDAILFVSVPDMNKRYLDDQILVHKRSGKLQMDINPWEHLNYFDVSHLDYVMKNAGFHPLKQAYLPGEVKIGLRPENHITKRLKNSISSLLRLVHYAFQGDALQIANQRYYKYCGEDQA